MRSPVRLARTQHSKAQPLKQKLFQFLACAVGGGHCQNQPPQGSCIRADTPAEQNGRGPAC
eukprot:7734354-Pyramimonas_sp.AAC.1